MDTAEECGLDGAWLAEMHFTPDRSVLSSPITIASSIATRTRRLRIGMAVYVLPLDNPLRIAEEVATVDQISAGRFDFGTGRSGFARSHDICGVPHSESCERFREALDIILPAWEGEHFSKIGRDGVVAELNAGGMIPHDAVVRNIRLLTEKVMPAFR